MLFVVLYILHLLLLFICCRLEMDDGTARSFFIAFSVSASTMLIRFSYSIVWWWDVTFSTRTPLHAMAKECRVMSLCDFVARTLISHRGCCYVGLVGTSDYMVYVTVLRTTYIL